jgi:hypothetical protein
MALFMTSVPRLKRMSLAVVICLITIWALLPIGGSRGSDRMFSAIVGARLSSGADVLRYIDPLIGTTNGGAI